MDLQRVEKADSPRVYFLKNFSKDIAENLNTRNCESGYEMPIKGGWGYDKESAVVIDRLDSVVDQNMPFNGTALEYQFAIYRLYIELYENKQDDESFLYSQDLDKQELIQDETGIYDKLIFDCKAIYPTEELTDEEFKNFNLLGDMRTVYFEREYWFEISSFYGQNVGAHHPPRKNIFMRQFDKLPAKIKFWAADLGLLAIMFIILQLIILFVVVPLIDWMQKSF